MSSLIPVAIKALNSINGQEIPGATVYIDGLVAGALQEVEGGMSHIFEAKAAGFSGQSTSILIAAGPYKTTPVTLLLNPADGSVSVRIQFYPAVSGIAFNLVNHGTGDSKAGTSFTSGVSQLAKVLPGSYTLAVNDPNYEPKSQPVEVSADKRSFVVSLVRKMPDGQQNSPVGPTIDTSGISSNPEDLIIADAIAEETYDNSAYLQYFTSTQARLYIGDLFIDQMVTIQWSMQQNNVPIFGYCSEYMDAIGRGRSVVQGQLVLNYVHQGYLYAALKNYEKKSGAGSTTSQTATTLTKLLRAGASSLVTPDQASQVAARTLDVLQASTPADIQQAQQLLRQAPGSDVYKANPIYRHSIFDMRLEIGDGAYRSVRMLEKCKLGVNEVLVHAQSGEPLAESYTFTARRAR